MFLDAPNKSGGIYDFKIWAYVLMPHHNSIGYIEANPVRSRSARLAAFPEDWPWSSAYARSHKEGVIPETGAISVAMPNRSISGLVLWEVDCRQEAKARSRAVSLWHIGKVGFRYTCHTRRVAATQGTQTDAATRSVKIINWWFCLTLNGCFYYLLVLSIT